ncbi:MAG: Hsp20/alpha crystallin family protein [Candidatus Nitrosotenuis sp.]|nr:MAG: Hsp20/alpha crystallin family protein [Candidatus Nitrosotenuis sp.]
MTFSVDGLVKELNSLMTLVMDAGTANKHLTNNQKITGLGVSANISIKVGLLESLSQNYGELANKDPLVDVFTNDDGIKLIALMPGIKKEDVEINMREGFIEVKIRKGDSLLYRNIPCNVRPDKIVVKSVAYNNSVLEIVFKKGDEIGSS